MPSRSPRSPQPCFERGGTANRGGRSICLFPRTSVIVRGREIDTTGDGFFVSFDSAAAAVLCARAIRESVRSLDLHVRIGVHTGEIEVTTDGVRGIAIHALARIMSAAGPSEILVSPVTNALTEGSDLTFVERGTHTLKGLAARMELFAVE